MWKTPLPPPNPRLLLAGGWVKGEGHALPATTSWAHRRRQQQPPQSAARKARGPGAAMARRRSLGVGVCGVLVWRVPSGLGSAGV